MYNVGLLSKVGWLTTGVPLGARYLLIGWLAKSRRALTYYVWVWLALNRYPNRYLAAFGQELERSSDWNRCWNKRLFARSICHNPILLQMEILKCRPETTWKPRYLHEFTYSSWTPWKEILASDAVELVILPNTINFVLPTLNCRQNFRQYSTILTAIITCLLKKL